MPFNLLLLPLVGGYFFLVTSRFFKYRHILIERQRLFFNSVLAGIVLLSLSFVIIYLAKVFVAEHVLVQLKVLLPLKLPYAGTAIFSLLLGILLAFLSNLFKKENKAIEEAIEARGSELEKLYLQAVRNRELVSLTLENGKVYVGIPMSIASPGKLSYITIFPMLSGYRTEQHEIEFTTEYIKVYEELLNEKARTDEHNPMVEEAKFLIVMPTSKVVSANQFDIDIFEKF